MLSPRELKVAAAGRWLEILAAAGLSSRLLDGRGHPCPRCGGRDRFAAWPDVAQRGAVHCRHCFTRGTDPRPGDGLSTLRWIGGGSWRDAIVFLKSQLGIVDDGVGEVRRWSPTVPIVDSGQIVRDRDAMERIGRDAAAFHRAMRPTWWTRLGARLRVSPSVLRAMGVGWDASAGAVSFPMFGPDGEVVGIRYRDMRTGSKWSAAGSVAGWFGISGAIDGRRRLFLPEGATDTAAMLSLGLAVVGRPSAIGGWSMVAAAVRRVGPREVVVVGDNDTAGVAGSRHAAARLIDAGYRVRTLSPPPGINDVRAWLAAGGDVALIEREVERRPMRFNRTLFDWARERVA